MSLELAGLLSTSGAVPPSVLDDALRRQVLAGGAFDTALLEAGAPLPEPECLRFLIRASGLPGLDGARLCECEAAATALLPARLAERHCLLPLRLDASALHVAVPFPISKSMLEEIGFLLGRQLKPFVAIEARLREAIARAYQVPLAPRYATLIEMLGPTPGAPPPAAAPLPAEPAPASEPAPAEKPAPVAVAPEEKPEEPVAAPAPEPEPEPIAATAPPLPLPAPPAPEARKPAPPARPGLPPPPVLTDERDGLTAALERVIEAAERDPRIIHRRAAPRDHVEAAGIANRIAVAAGGTAVEPIEKWTFGKAKAALEAAFDRHAIIGVTLRFALKTFDFSAAFAVVGGNAVGWTALTPEGFCPERVERVSLPLDVQSVLHTVLFTRGRYLGPLPSDPISQQLLTGMGRPTPTVAFVCPIEVRDRPVAILYADAVGRAASDRRVAELVAFAQLLSRRLERLILENKRKLTEAAPPAPPPAPTPAIDKPEAPRPESEAASPAAVPPPPALPSFVLDPPTPTAAEIFARSPLRPKKATGGEATRGPALPTSAPMPAPGVSRLASRAGPSAPAVQELHVAADKLVGTDLAERAKAMGILSRSPEVAAAVLATRFPGPLLRARVALTELPAAEELGPVPAALARLGSAAARALVPLIEHRDPDCRYYAILTAGRISSPVVVGPIAGHVFDHQALVANAARVALAALRHVVGFSDSLSRVRSGLQVRDAEMIINAAKAVGPLHDLPAVEKLIELTGSADKEVGQAAADALREITKQTFGTNSAKWAAWWDQNKTRPRSAFLVEALRHRDLDLRLSAIDELVRAVNDNFGYYADGPKADRDQAIQRWIVWYREQGANIPIE